jgi:hypothetical protein
MTTTTDPRNIDPRDIVGPEVVAEIAALTAELGPMLDQAKELAPRIAAVLEEAAGRCHIFASSLPDGGAIAPNAGFYEDEWNEAVSLRLNVLAADVGGLLTAAADVDRETMADLMADVHVSLDRTQGDG